MNPNNACAMALSEGQYAPHAYAFRQLHGYERSAELGRIQPRSVPGAAPDLSSIAPSAWPNDGPQTVEQVTKQGYFAVSNAEPEIAIIQDKKRTAWLGLDDVIAQIRHREEIYLQNLYEIELAKCDAINALFTWEAQYGWPADAKEQYVLGKRLQALYADQRAERVAVWKDISRLRQTLPEAAQSYLSALRKLTVLEDTRGDDA